MNQALTIAGAELRLMLRSRLALVGIATLLLLSAIAAVTSATQMAAAAKMRAEAQAATDAQFKAQPDRHPHRMVHYGTYALRPVGPLAAFDPGVDAFTGTLLFLHSPTAIVPWFLRIMAFLVPRSATRRSRSSRSTATPS